MPLFSLLRLFLSFFFFIYRYTTNKRDDKNLSQYFSSFFKKIQNVLFSIPLTPSFFFFIIYFFFIIVCPNCFVMRTPIITRYQFFFFFLFSCGVHPDRWATLCNNNKKWLKVDLRHIDEVEGSNIVDIGMDLSEFYMSVEWDILDVPAVR